MLPPRGLPSLHRLPIFNVERDECALRFPKQEGELALGVTSTRLASGLINPRLGKNWNVYVPGV